MTDEQSRAAVQEATDPSAGLNSEINPTKSEQAQQLINHLVPQIMNVRRGGPARKLLDDLRNYAERLTEDHRYFRDASQQAVTLTYASEWVLDNDYIIRQAIRQIREDLPPGYYEQLPRLTGGLLTGFPRIYAVAHALLTFQNLALNSLELEPFMIQLQERVPLTMGELWALPIFLRYGLIEALAQTLEQVIHPDQPQPMPTPSPEIDSTNDEAVANAILSLRSINEQDWSEFFENVSKVEQILREDPAGIYPHMDFDSRDLYRKAVEKLALASGKAEREVASAAQELAKQYSRQNGHINQGLILDRQVHNGFYLIGGGCPALEAMLNYHPAGRQAFLGWASAHTVPLYLGSIALLSLLILSVFGLPVFLRPTPAWLVLLILLLLLVPALSAGTSLVNWLVTLLLPPKVLPKLRLVNGIPTPFRTLVVMPALISSKEEIASLVQQLEMHMLRNPDEGLSYALLTDFSDADQETLPEDEALIDYASQAIDTLNQKYTRSSVPPPFYFLNRRRVWNPGEGKWMGWERKRGKLHELNQLLRGADPASLTFSAFAGDMHALRDLLHPVRFVITLDADTILPSGTARRLIGTLAHPLNRAVFDEPTGWVIAGYTLLQPRMEISAQSANLSWFTRIFAGDTGLDLYTLAVSDVYQDLFGEGIYVGKGIYDVQAFERSVAGHIPDNRLLSHDLLEGLMGRVGLVTDITMIEDYPAHYYEMILRQRRWVRGDWQLLPWLFASRAFGVHFTIIDRWKIFDNLRRSLFAPGLLSLFIISMITASGAGWWWAGVLLVTLGVALITSLGRGLWGLFAGHPPETLFHPVGWDLLRWILAVVFLPYEAYSAIDAILTTLWRMWISHRHLLQWTSAAHAALLFHENRNTAWEKLGAESLLAAAIGVLVFLLQPAHFMAAAPILLLWLVSPVIVRFINQPYVQHAPPLSIEQVELLRRVARRTWSFFEQFVGPDDHWLPPDHYQEHPVGMAAHRTSPTNIGLLLVSTLTAYDLGYIDQLGLVSRLQATFQSLEKLQRYRGHFLNWYDTLSLQPLNPRYVSTVDSGNLAASLIVVSQACQVMAQQVIFRWELWQGYLDTLSILLETLTNQAKAKDTEQIVEVVERIESMRQRILAAKERPGLWYDLFKEVTGPFWKAISACLLELVSQRQSGGGGNLDLATLRVLQQIAAQIERQHLAVQRTIAELVPWLPMFENAPLAFKSGPLQSGFAELQARLPDSPSIGDIEDYSQAACQQVDTLREQIQQITAANAAAAGESARPAEMGKGTIEIAAAAAQKLAQAPLSLDQAEEARNWLDALEQKLKHAAIAAGTLLKGYAYIIEQAENYINEMDFRFLYDSHRRIFHIGYNLDAGQLDANYYDLLASEARIASIIAIAKGEVPQSHWLHLNRPITRVEGLRVLLSWSATMFEYLMPPLFLRSYTDTLLAESSQGAVLRQIAYARSKGLPWGISEFGLLPL